MRHLTTRAASFEVVLNRPEIPPNTGSVARLCACTGSRLHLVAPLGFSLDDAKLKRAGLDYWDKVFVATHSSLEEVIASFSGRGVHLFTGKTTRTIWDARFRPGDLLVFGSESVGLPERLLLERPESTVAIPMLEGRRSLNLATAVAVAVYEGLRQNEPVGIR